MDELGLRMRAHCSRVASGCASDSGILPNAASPIAKPRNWAPTKHCRARCVQAGGVRAPTVVAVTAGAQAFPVLRRASPGAHVGFVADVHHRRYEKDTRRTERYQRIGALGVGHRFAPLGRPLLLRAGLDCCPPVPSRSPRGRLLRSYSPSPRARSRTPSSSTLPLERLR